MTDPVSTLPDRPLEVADYEAIDASSAPIRAVPLSWYDESIIYSLVLFLTDEPDDRPIVIAFDEFDEQWVVVDEPDPDRGFDELGEILRPWFADQYDDVPDELDIVPPDYDLYDELVE